MPAGVLSVLMRKLAPAVAALIAVCLPVAAGAQDPTTTTTAPATVPSTPVPETALTVGDEAAYRAALTALSADAAGPHTITLSADITVDDGTDPTYTGTEDLTVEGAGFTLDAAGTSRLLVIDSPADATLILRDVTMRNGVAAGDGGAVLVGNASTLFVHDSRFEANTASGSGGAVHVPLAATVERSDFVGNEATTGDGGAIDAVDPIGRFAIDRSQFQENRAPQGDGGAVSAVGSDSIGDLAVERSTFVGNRALRGGGLVVAVGAVLANSTIVDNTATAEGGGLLAENRNVAAALYLTLTGNAAPTGANVSVQGNQLRFLFSVLAEPVGGTNCAGLSGLSASHADDASCGAASQGGAAELGPLGDNGGRTLTREPLPGSPLIDAVELGYGFPSLPGGCDDFLSLDGFDQRGVERPQDGDGEIRLDDYGGQVNEVPADCDIGAVEARADVAPPTGPVPAGPPFTG